MEYSGLVLGINFPEENLYQNICIKIHWIVLKPGKADKRVVAGKAIPFFILLITIRI